MEKRSRDINRVIFWYFPGRNIENHGTFSLDSQYPGQGSKPAPTINEFKSFTVMPPRSAMV